jgi:FkbM family methyltransferase
MDHTDYLALQRLHALGIAPDCIYDVGSSNGCWSEMACSLYPQATCVLFEPLIQHSSEYMQGLEPLRMAHPEWILRPNALGETEGEIQLTRFENEVGSTTLPQDGGLIDMDTISVPLHTVDGLVQRQELPTPSLIKIDTQGSELSILNGAANTLPTVEVLFLECWLQKAYGAPTPLFQELVDFLLPFGFRLWDFCGQFRSENGILVSQDMVFLNVRLFRSRGVDWIRAWDYPPESMLS